MIAGFSCSSLRSGRLRSSRAAQHPEDHMEHLGRLGALGILLLGSTALFGCYAPPPPPPVASAAPSDTLAPPPAVPVEPMQYGSSTPMVAAPSAAGTATVVAPYAPPPPQAETPPPAPSPLAVWQPGYWAWNGAQFAWTPGHYVMRPTPTANWVPGHWQQGPGGWSWIDGYWSCRRSVAALQREFDQRHQHRRGRQRPVDDVGGAEPGDFVGIVAGRPFTRAPAPAYRHQGVVETHPARVVAVDRVDHGQRADRLGDDAGLFEKLTHRPGRDGLAQFEDAAGKPPAPGHRRIGAAHDQRLVAAQHHRQHADNRPLGIAPGFAFCFAINDGRLRGRCHCAAL